jgi:hypothetical protein
VINISLGGGGAGQSLLNAIDSATKAGIVIVISAGNDGTANPDEFAMSIAQQSGNGRVIIAGATDASRQLATFSNKAGTGAQYYLTALGDRVRTFDQNGTSYLYSGTSPSPILLPARSSSCCSAPPTTRGPPAAMRRSATAFSTSPGPSLLRAQPRSPVPRRRFR